MSIPAVLIAFLFWEVIYIGLAVLVYWSLGGKFERGPHLCLLVVFCSLVTIALISSSLNILKEAQQKEESK